jgi:tetratricopeptide (TPR) repeat protein
MEIALHALQGEIAARGGRHDEAIVHFQAAAALEDGLQYIEPPDWYYPIRHSLGAALLQAGKPAEAEAVYREDLKRFPENGWSLYGLAQALHAQGKGDEAAETERRFERAWAGADVKLTASRF